MRRLILAPALALALVAPNVQAAPAPQVTDPSGDANFGANLVTQTRDQSLPVGNQAYADVVSVLWETKKTTKKVRGKNVTTVTAFTVTATMSAPPAPPAPTQIVFRMLGSVPGCTIFGVVYYTKKSSDPGIPQSALRENCGDDVIRLHAIPMPAIDGSKITWTVPVSAIPAATKVKPGTKITDLWFEVRELQDFQGYCLPDLSTVPNATVQSYSKACGLAAGIVDNSQKMGVFTFG